MTQKDIKPFQLHDNSCLLDKNFTLGVATSSYQIEGATHSDGRIASIWDTFSHTPGKVKHQHNGDIACDHYHRYPEDIKLIHDLGFDAYRFSIAWPRVITADGKLNTKGIAFYQNLVAELDKYGIRAYATLYHWDLPQHLEDKGGWLNRETAYRFAEYAGLVMQKLGDGLSAVATLNEPWVSAHLGYHLGTHAPGIQSEKAGFSAAHHLLLAHGLGMQAIRAESPELSAGIVLNMTPCYPATLSVDDQISCQLENTFNNDWFAQPILSGSYPYWLQHIKSDRMPLIKDNDLSTIAQPIDFLGINYYTRNLIGTSDNGAVTVRATSGEHTAFDWEVYPEGLSDLLIGLKNRYTNLPPIYITENGCAYEDNIAEGFIDDENRRYYYQQHLNALNDAYQAGVDIKGYFAWSLMDNFEWAEGYDMRFGITHVDFDTQQRTPKHSALAFQALNRLRQSR